MNNTVFYVNFYNENCRQCNRKFKTEKQAMNFCKNIGVKNIRYVSEVGKNFYRTLIDNVSCLYGR